MTCDRQTKTPSANGSMLRDHDHAVAHLARLLKVKEEVDEAIDKHFAKPVRTVKLTSRFSVIDKCGGELFPTELELTPDKIYTNNATGKQFTFCLGCEIGGCMVEVEAQ